VVITQLGDTGILVDPPGLRYVGKERARDGNDGLGNRDNGSCMDGRTDSQWIRSVVAKEMEAAGTESK